MSDSRAYDSYNSVSSSNSTDVENSFGMTVRKIERNNDDVIIRMIRVIGIALYVIFTLGCIAVYSIQIYLGDEHHCSNDNLNTWLIVNGSFCIVVVLVSLYDDFIKEVFDTDDDNIYCEIILGIVNLFLFIWLIFGTIWFINYDVGPNYSRCDKLMYKYGLGVIIGEWIVVGIALIVCIAYAIAILYLLHDENK